MEPPIKLVKKISCFLLLTTLQGCWTTENDIIEVSKLVGNFNVVYNQNDVSAGYILGFTSDNGSYQHIEKRCEDIYFDSTEIFVKYTWNNADTIQHYSRIRIFEKEKAPYQKQELSGRDFYKRVKSCKDCTEIKYNKGPGSPSPTYKAK